MKKTAPIPLHPYDRDFPRDEGPPSSGTLIDLSATKPTFTVTLDAGAFRVVWETIEADARRRYPMHGKMATADALARAVVALRQASAEQSASRTASEERVSNLGVRKVRRRAR